MVIAVYFYPVMTMDKVFFISGESGIGKTTFVKQLIDKLSHDNIPMAGFYAEGIWSNDERAGFDLVDVQTGTKMPLCTTDYEATGIPFRRFYFYPEALTFGQRILSDCKGSHRVVIVDEVGPFELQGGGWAAALDDLLQNPPRVLICTARPSIVKSLATKWNILPIVYNDLSSYKMDELYKELKQLFH